MEIDKQTNKDYAQTTNIETQNNYHYHPTINVPHLLTKSPMKVDKAKFIHREKELEEIKALITSGEKIVLVNGLGGIGKTAIARCLYHGMKDNYLHAAWIEYHNNLQDSMLASFNLYEEEKEPKIRYRKIENFITNQGKKLLLFVDNVSKTVGEDKSLGLLNTIDARIVVTSRMPQMNHFTSYLVELMDKEECIDIFYKYYEYDKKREQEKVVKSLVELACRHTLTIELLARAANAPKYRKLETFKKNLEDKGFQYLEKKIGTEHTAEEKTVEEHLKILYNMMEIAEESRYLVKNFAYLPSITIPYEIEEWMNCSIDALDQFVKLGWIQEQETGYSMPDIVKKAIKEQTKIELEDCEEIIRYIIEEAYFIETESYGAYVAKIQIADAYIELFEDKGTETVAILLIVVGYAHHRQGEYEKALEYYEKALMIIENVQGKEHPNTIVIYNSMAGVYEDQGRYEKALEYYEKALMMGEKVLEKEHPNTVTTYNDIAGVYVSQGKYEKALEYYEKVLMIIEKVQRKDHPNTATTYNNIAVVYVSLEKYEEALEYYKKALMIGEKVQGTEHPNTAATYNNIAVVYGVKGEYEKALEYYEKVLMIIEKVLGKEHPNTATTYNNMAGVYGAQGQYEKALEFYEKALMIGERVLGKEHPDMAKTYSNMADVYKAQGQYNKALEYYKKALMIIEKVQGKEHRHAGITYNNIAVVLFAQKNYKEALDYFFKAYFIIVNLYGENDQTQSIFNNMKINYEMLHVKLPFDYWLKRKVKNMHVT